MAVKKVATIARYTGLAGDTMPTGVPCGSTFWAYDTQTLYITYDGTNWEVKDDILVRIGAVTASPAANTVLARLKSLLTGMVLAAGTAVIGKVRNNPVFNPATGAGAISLATAPGAIFRLLRVELHLDAAPTQETFTITLDAGDGAAYDVLLFSENMATDTPADLIIPFGDGYEFEADDEIDLAWTNTDGRTYGVRVVYELL